MDTKNWIRSCALTFPALFALLAIPSALYGQVAAAAGCEMVFEPATIAAGAPAQEVSVTLKLSEGAELDPAQIGAIRTPEESGLQLARVEGDAFVLAVDPSSAQAGEWQIEALSGAAGDGDAEEPLCVGKLQVQ